MNKTNIALLLSGLLLIAMLVVVGATQAKPALAAPPFQGSDENCLACHTSKTTLQELAVEPEEEESLSEDSDEVPSNP